MTKEYPILFSAEMVKAILDGSKTMTRRINKDPILGKPLADIGDLLWVRETHFRVGRWISNGFTPRGRVKWKFIPVGETAVRYLDNPPEEFKKSRDKDNPSALHWYKRNARFMPKNLCRTWLEVTEVRGEQLQSITEADAIKEGIKNMMPHAKHTTCVYKNYSDPNVRSCKPLYSFKSLWSLINGPESWDANPWVWVISFKKILKQQ